VTVNNAYGHVLALVATVREMSRRGHDVLVGCPGPTASVLAADGVRISRYHPAGGPPPVVAPPRDQLAARLEWAVRTSWPNVARGWAPKLLADATEFQPHVVVCEPVEHAGRAVAAALDVPLVEHGWGFSLPAGWERSAVDGLADLYRAMHAEPREPALRVDFGPERLQAADIEANIARYRFTPWAPPADALPAPGARRRILLTLGTFAHPGAAERLRLVAAAAASVDAELVVVLGHADRGTLSGFPPGALVTPWVDLPAEISRCALVIHHAGAGTSWATLAAGVPAVCLPQAGDQFRDAALLSAAGAAVTVAPQIDDVAPLAGTIAQALVDPALHAAAQQLRQENDELPATGALVDLIESTTS
jgi:UDP:flavonoid glycosyltransferase YjiC (YdhE family)